MRSQEDIESRACTGFFLAPAFGALFVALVFSSDGMGTALLALIVAYLVGLFLTLSFGFPAFVLLRRRMKLTLLNCILVGGAVMLAPWVVALVVGFLLWLIREGLSGEWPLFAILMAPGLIGGAAFWWIVIADRRWPSPKAR